MTESPIQISRSAAVKVSLPCDLTAVRPAVLEVRKFLRDQDVDAAEIQACELALAEACNNAIQYACRSESVQVEVSCDPVAVKLAIRDHTPGFDWPAKVTLPEPSQERGRGLFLIRSLMDEANYFRSAEANCLVLQKRRVVARRPGPISRLSLEQATHQLRESEHVISDMAEELSFCYESLSAIFRCSAELGRTDDLKEFSQRLLSDLAQITGSDWFVLRLLARDGNALTVFTASDPGLKMPPLPVRGPGVRPCLELRAALERQDIWFDGDGRLEPGDPLSAYPGRITGLIHPFFLGDQLIGTVAIGSLGESSQFTVVHANVVHTFADFLGIQMANARFQEDQVHARLVSRELEIAKNIQRSLLPKSLPRLPGYELAGYCESAQGVGGDFYDVVKADGHSGGGFLLIVADVMGTGVPAAMFAAILRSLLRAVPEWTRQPAHLLSRVNRLLFRELSGVDMFITAQLVFVDMAEQRIVTASAGHCPMLLGGGERSAVKVVSPEGLPLGILPDTTFHSQTETFSANSRILLYTDGLTEARNPDGEFFGQDRLVDWFRKSLSRSHSAEELKKELATELDKFQGPAALQDDQTFLILA